MESVATRVVAQYPGSHSLSIEPRPWDRWHIQLGESAWVAMFDTKPIGGRVSYCVEAMLSRAYAPMHSCAHRPGASTAIGPGRQSGTSGRGGRASSGQDV